MKRFLVILICVIGFTACDDGDLVVETINFDQIATSNCTNNNLIYKLRGEEALILNLPTGTFKNNPTSLNDTIRLNLKNDSNTQVVYNFYDSNVGTASVCDLIAPASPNIINQLKAIDGTVTISTNAVISVNETDGSTKITSYKNNIVFKNIVFQKSDGSKQNYERLVFGDYTSPGVSPSMIFSKELDKCDNLIYVSQGFESLTLLIDPNLIKNVPTPIDAPITGTIELDKNKLTYRNNNVEATKDYLCNSAISSDFKEEWIGRVGGTIEVTTTNIGPKSFKHIIMLKNIIFDNQNSNFQLGKSFKYGELFTVEP